MNTDAQNLAESRFALHEGMALLSAPDAILKGAFEADPGVAMVVGPAVEPFDSLFRRTGEAVTSLLRQHSMQLLPTPTASRAVVLATQASQSGRNSLVLVPNAQFHATIPALRRARERVRGAKGVMCVLLEDHPLGCPGAGPRSVLGPLGYTCIEPSDVDALRDSIEQAVRLGRAAEDSVAIVAHVSTLRSADTLELRPNRVTESVDALLARRRGRRSRMTEGGDLLRQARRQELNRVHHFPSPGERLPLGFIVVGHAEPALSEMLHTFRLRGRFPILHLGLLEPLDEPPVSRLLRGCENVIVLEPRPGEIELRILDVAEQIRHHGHRCAHIWGRDLPAPDDGAAIGMGPNDCTHPSIVARRVLPALRMARPTLDVLALLEPDPPHLAHPAPAELPTIGVAAALADMRTLLVEVDQWLRERPQDEVEGAPATALAIDGDEPQGFDGRVVCCETWAAEPFVAEGFAAVRQATRSDRPWILLVCDIDGPDGIDVERLVRAVVPGKRADLVHIDAANLHEPDALREVLREAAMREGITVLIVRDGPPHRFDSVAINRAAAEIDRLGFQPRQQLVRTIDSMCALRTPSETAGAPDAPPFSRVHKSLERVSGAGKSVLRVQPLAERVEVLRTRPPARAQRTDIDHLPAPVLPMHGSQALWRAHIAGFCGTAPGLATRVLAEAGRAMGYCVRTIHDPTTIAAGRRAWSQVLYTHPRREEAAPVISARIPFGEAQLLLGVDARQALRAAIVDDRLRVAAADQTYAVVNTGGLEDAGEPRLSHEMLAADLGPLIREEPRVIADYTSACRAWLHNDRIVELAMLGAAFQLGLVPITLDAAASALRRTERQGFARAREAFHFGRRLAIDEPMFASPSDQRESVERLARWMGLSVARERFGGRERADRLRRLLSRSLDAMPGLTETDPGRQARRDFVLATYRCMKWGGLDYAERYVDLVLALYQTDRGDRGRALTRNAILPLADAMLIRDLLYVSAVVTSREQHRRTRRELTVRSARGDEITRRYVTRVEIIALKRRIRFDVNSGEGLARLIPRLGRLWSDKWRGSRRARSIRAVVTDFTVRAATGAAADYDRWADAMHRLHLQAEDDRLRGMALSELRMLLGPTE